MSSQANAPVRDTSTVAQRARRGWQRWRWPLLVTGCVAAVALLLALLMPRTGRGDLDPDSATPTAPAPCPRSCSDRVSR